MRPTQFLISSSAAFFLLAAFYAFMIDRLAIPDQILPYPYSQFLLESTASIEGKVVISSGSNSIHSFDTQILSDYFQAPVIIVADSAANPLRYRIYNFINHLNPGDLLILPLEWRSYRSKEAFSEPFLENVIQRERAYDYYFNGLPFIEKLDFIFRKLPLKVALDSFLMPKRVGMPVIGDRFFRSASFEKRINRGDNQSFGGVVRDGPEEIHTYALFNTCDSYIFGGEADRDFGGISEVFLSNLDLLEKLRENDVSVYFTWPTVVDSEQSNCYEGVELQDRLDQYADSLVRIVESRGFQFLGLPEDSHFDSSCFLNTYYHIRYSCAIARTNSFVTLLSEHAVAPLNNSLGRDQSSDVIERYLADKRQLLLEKKRSQLRNFSEGVVSGMSQRSSVLFHSGWSRTEAGGTWSIGAESIFEIRLAPSLLSEEFVYLEIDGQYYNGEEKTEVEINGVPYEPQILNHQSFRIPSQEILNQRVTVRLRHFDVRSPKMLGISESTRMIKFKLQNVSLNRLQHN